MTVTEVVCIVNNLAVLAITASVTTGSVNPNDFHVINTE